MGTHTVYDFAANGYNFAIRVGEDGDEIGNNKICTKLLDYIESPTANFTCSPALFGDWISINKSNTDNTTQLLLLYEVYILVFSKYCDIVSSAVITRSNIVRYYIYDYRNWSRISIRYWNHKRHPIPRPNGRAMGCILWIFVRKPTAL